MIATLLLALTLTAAPAEARFPLHSEIYAGLADHLQTVVELAEAAHVSRVYIDIDSPGGDAQEGLKMARVLRASRVPTVCHVSGMAASAAFIILEACGTRTAARDAQLICHHPFATLNRPMPITPELARQIADALQALADDADAQIARRLGMRVENLRSMIANGAQWIMTADQALRAGALDSVL